MGDRRCIRPETVWRGYTGFMEASIRELRDNLSRYVRRAEAGERVSVTVNGRVVAELAPVATAKGARRGGFDQLVEAGVMIPPEKGGGDPLASWPRIRLPKGTAASLIDADRDEA